MKNNLMKKITKHKWFPLCSDINTHWSDTYHWWKCERCGKETEHTKKNDVKPPVDEDCKPKKDFNIFPLSSI